MTRHLPRNYEINIDKTVFDSVFQDDFDVRGYQVCGVLVYEMKTIYNDNEEFPEYVEVLEKLPEEIKASDSDMNFLIKSDNLKSFVEKHILMDSYHYEDNFEEVIEIIKQNEPHKIENNEINPKYLADFVDFIYDELIKTSKLIVNGQQIYILDYANDGFCRLQVDVIREYYK